MTVAEVRAEMASILWWLVPVAESTTYFMLYLINGCYIHLNTTANNFLRVLVLPQTILITKDENGRKTPQPFSTFTFEYENENENGKVGHENEHELTEYREFQKRTNSNEIMSNTVSIRKFNTEYRFTVHNN
jgi:hypothetical protein